MTTTEKREPVPRGLARTGPVILSYGFRLFFLAAGVWASLAMSAWVLSLAMGLEIGGSYGPAAWHAHEMLFGYTSAALAGFLLTAIPNWTGRLPVSGLPLLSLFAVWLLGRLAFLVSDAIGLHTAVLLDAMFLPVLLAVCAREIVSGRKWRDLKILAGIGALALANAGFHWLVIVSGDASLASRLAVAAYIMLIGIIGGRIVPSFTRNWLAKRGSKALPTPYNHFDTAGLIAAFAALVLWVMLPGEMPTAAACLLAAVAQAWRLLRWKGWSTTAEFLVLVLHVAYLFVPLGFVAAAAAAFGVYDPVSALHLFTVGAIGLMTLAVMSRASRGHTGTILSASRTTCISYAFMVLAAIARPLATILPDHYLSLVSISGMCWIASFLLFAAEYAPILLTKRKPLPQ